MFYNCHTYTKPVQEKSLTKHDRLESGGETNTYGVDQHILCWTNFTDMEPWHSAILITLVYICIIILKSISLTNVCFCVCLKVFYFSTPTIPVVYLTKKCKNALAYAKKVSYFTLNIPPLSCFLPNIVPERYYLYRATKLFIFYLFTMLRQWILPPQIHLRNCIV